MRPIWPGRYGTLLLMAKALQAKSQKNWTDHVGGQSALTKRVVDNLCRMVQKGELLPGSRLPAERDLAQMLKVSRSSVRAGIGFLSAMGVLRPRHGSGTYIADGPPSFDANMLQVMGALHGFRPQQMFEARMVIEQGLAGLAAERATDQQLAGLADEVAEMYASLDDPQAYLVHDVRFHRALAAAAANPILTALMETITAALYGQRRETIMYAQDIKESAEMHREIYRAVRERDAVRDRSMMAQHLDQAQSAQAREAVDVPGQRTQKGRSAAVASGTQPGRHGPSDRLTD
jgi:GntR family transcriptional repressor for pyruvate dehydrogenase complex